MRTRSSGLRITRRFCSLFALIACCCLWVPRIIGQGFAVSTSTAALTIHPGDKNVPIPVQLSGDTSATNPVTVTVTGLPSGITVTPLVLTPGSAGTLLLTASVAADQEAFPANNPANPDAGTSTVTVLAFAGAQTSSTSLALTVSLQNPSFAPAPGAINLPVLRIDTGNTPIGTTDVAGTVTITSADGQTSYLPGSAGTDNTATFHVHGNSTAQMPKKPYTLKLNTGTDLLTAMGLQCGYVTSSGKPVCDKSKSYLLLANYDDKTLLRDWSASALANTIPIGGQFLGQSASAPTPSGTSTLMPWAPHSLFVELYLNGEYEGNYQLIEAIKVDSHRVNITEMSSGNISGNALTGGYLVEIDTHQDEDYNWITPQGLYLGLEDPDSSPEVPAQTAYITNYVNSAEVALFSSTYTDPATGWRAYFDQASAVNFYLVNDLLGNVDSGDFYSSVYLYKDRTNPLLYMGPVWDFDISSGNVNYAAIVDPTAPWMQTQALWYKQLFTDPAFKTATQTQWNALKSSGILNTWLNSIANEAAMLQQSQSNNFGRWPMQGIRVWPNPEANGSYDGEVSYLLNWIRLRMGYLDASLNNLPASATTLTVPAGALRTGTPVTLTAQVSGRNPAGTVTFSYNSIILGTATLDGTGTASLTTTAIAPGSWSLEVYYNGDAQNAISGAPPISVMILPPLTQTSASLTDDASADSRQQTLTASVVAMSGTTAPTGSFTFTVNGNPLGTAPVMANGLASLVTGALPLGNDVLQATYSGDDTYAASTTNTVSLTSTQNGATVLLGNTTANYNGAPQSVTVTTQPAGLHYTVTYDGTSTLPAAVGIYTVVARVDDAGYIGASTGTLTIHKGVPTMLWSAPAAITYGTPLSGVQLNATSVVAGTLTYTPAPGTVVHAGTQTLSATLTPTDDANYLAVTSTVQVVVNRQSSRLALSGSATSIVPDQSLSLFATVTGAVNGTPTGTVSFFDGTILLGTQPVVDGRAAYFTANLAPGPHNLSATYAGDNDYLASSLTSGSLAVAVAPLDFTFSQDTAAVAGKAETTGVSASGGRLLSFALAPLYGTYPGQVTFTVTGLPSTMQYTLSQDTVASTAGPVNILLSIAAARTTVAITGTGRSHGMWAACLLLLPFAGARARKRLRRHSLTIVFLALASCVLLNSLLGCGNQTASAQRTYHVVVTATSGQVHHSAQSDLIF